MPTANSKNFPSTTQSKIASLALRKVRKLNSQVKDLAQRCADLENVVAQAEAEARLNAQQLPMPVEFTINNKSSRKRKVSGGERRASRTDNDRRSALLGAHLASLRVERASRLMTALAKRRASDAIASKKEATSATRSTKGEQRGGIVSLGLRDTSYSYNVSATGYTMGCELKRSVFLDRESKSGTRS